MHGGKYGYCCFNHSKVDIGKEREFDKCVLMLLFRSIIYLCNPSSKSGVNVASIFPLNLTTTEFRVAVSFCDVMNSFSSPIKTVYNCINLMEKFSQENEVTTLTFIMICCISSTNSNAWIPWMRSWQRWNIMHR